MDSTTIRRGVELAWCFAALAAMWMLTRTLPGSGAFAPVAITLALAVVFLAIMDGGRSPLILGVPSLAVVLLLVPGDRAKLLASGIVLAACLAAAGWRWGEGGRVPVVGGITLLVAALGPAVALPSGGSGLTGSLLAAAGAVAIVVAGVSERRVGIDLVMIAYCAALAAPVVPLRASLGTFVLAATVLLLRRPGPLTAGALVLLVLAAGKWYLPFLVAVAAGFAVRRMQASRRDGIAASAVALPLMSGVPVAGVAALAVGSDVWTRVREAGVVAAGAGILLAAGSLIVQPSLATIYAISAIGCLVAAGGAGRWSPTLVAFTLVMSGLTAWSGVVSGAFPLPLSLGVIIMVAVGSSAGGHSWWVRSEESLADDCRKEEPGRAILVAAAAGAAALLVLVHPALEPSRETIAVDLRVPSGDSVSVPLPDGLNAVRLEVSGGNTAGLKDGTVVGILRAEPGGESRELRIGEVADWGVRRRPHFLSANNPRPITPAGPVIGEGREAFLSGSGVVRFEVRGSTSLTIEALPAIGESGRLLIASVEAAK